MTEHHATDGDNDTPLLLATSQKINVEQVGAGPRPWLTSVTFETNLPRNQYTTLHGVLNWPGTTAGQVHVVAYDRSGAHLTRNSLTIYEANARLGSSYLSRGPNGEILLDWIITLEYGKPDRLVTWLELAESTEAKQAESPERTLLDKLDAVFLVGSEELGIVVGEDLEDRTAREGAGPWFESVGLTDGVYSAEIAGHLSGELRGYTEVQALAYDADGRIAMKATVTVEVVRRRPTFAVTIAASRGQIAAVVLAILDDATRPISPAQERPQQTPAAEGAPAYTHRAMCLRASDSPADIERLFDTAYRFGYEPYLTLPRPAGDIMLLRRRPEQTRPGVTEYDAEHAAFVADLDSRSDQWTGTPPSQSELKETSPGDPAQRNDSAEG